MFGIRSGTEEPRYDTLATIGKVQIRHYAPRIAASVTVPGNEIGARAAGFRRVAKYIFGANKPGSKIAMTAPVAQNSANIAMTAPVAQAASGGNWTISFYMPAEYTMETLPTPKDPGIQLQRVPACTMAVYRYSGIPGVSATTKAHDALFKGLSGTAWTVSGQPVDWFYDPPWTLPWARRNEVAVPVAHSPP